MFLAWALEKFTSIVFVWCEWRSSSHQYICHIFFFFFFFICHIVIVIYCIFYAYRLPFFPPTSWIHRTLRSTKKVWIFFILNFKSHTLGYLMWIFMACRSVVESFKIFHVSPHETNACVSEHWTKWVKVFCSIAHMQPIGFLFAPRLQHV